MTFGLDSAIGNNYISPRRPLISKFSGRDFIAYFLFAFTCAFSTVTLTPQFSMYRYPIYERYLDVFFLIFIGFLTRRVLAPRARVSWILSLAIVAVVISSIFAIKNFGYLYFFIEYRQYIIIFSLFFLLCLLRKRIDALLLSKTMPIYFIFMIFNAAMGLVYAEYYRPGVFGESNYDLAYVGAVILANYSLRGLSYNPLLTMILFSALSQSRTAALTAVLLAFIRVRSVRDVFIFLALGSSAYLLFQNRLWDISGNDLSSVFQQVDRIQFAIAYMDAIEAAPLLAIVGQAFSGITFSSEAMSFYLDTQKASESLGFNTPSNFHGHLLRGFVLIGPLLYLLFLWGLLSQAARVHHQNSLIFILIVILSTALTQSIFSHPFSGSLFAIVCICGFAVKQKTN